jgi:hypothetical protein
MVTGYVGEDRLMPKTRRALEGLLSGCARRQLAASPSSPISRYNPHEKAVPATVRPSASRRGSAV